MNGFVKQAATVYAGTYFLDKFDGTETGAHGSIALKQGTGAVTLVVSAAVAIATVVVAMAF